MAPDKSQVKQMFDRIAPRYDLLNHLLSFGSDFRWRRKFVRLLSKENPQQILDIATGTGDLAFAMARLKPASITAMDISEEMLAIAREKSVKNKTDRLIRFMTGDAESIQFPESSFDAVTVAFGVRNFGDLEKGLREMKRILRPGGVMMILEFSHPSKSPFKQLYRFYSKSVIPFIGRMISHHRDAYNYLPDSVATFPSGGDFLAILENIGIKNCTLVPVTGGIVTIYIGYK